MVKFDRKWKYDFEFCGNKHFKGMANICFGMCVGVGMLSEEKNNSATLTGIKTVQIILLVIAISDLTNKPAVFLSLWICYEKSLPVPQKKSTKCSKGGEGSPVRYGPF